MKRRLFFCLLAGVLCLQQALWGQSSLSSSLRRHVDVLCQQSLQGRRVGSRGETAAANYISKCFENSGLDFLYPEGLQDFSMLGPDKDTLRSQNVVAIVEGCDPVLKHEYIVVGAHYDHLGSYHIRIDGKDSLCIYEGANANASGVAALLELSRRAAQQSLLFKRSLIFVAFGAEEAGMVGSWYFINRAFAPFEAIKMMINIDMIGLYSEQNAASAYICVPDSKLEQCLADLNRQPGVQPVEISSSDYFPSDHKAFLEKKIPVCLFTTGLFTQYHTLRDKREFLDYDAMERFTEYIFLFLQQAANSPALYDRTSEHLSKEAAEWHACSEVDKPPLFQNSDLQAFERWIYKYLRYPYDALRKGIQGTVLVSFIIEVNGQLGNVKIERSVDESLDREALRVINVSPKWKAGEINGEKVRVKCVVPVHFKLSPTR